MTITIPMTLDLAVKAIKHMNEHKRDHCYLMSGEEVTREDCENVIKEHTTLSWN